VIGNIVFGNSWQYVPKPGGFLKKVRLQTRYYMRDVFLGRPHPFPPALEANFNALQQIRVATLAVTPDNTNIASMQDSWRAPGTIGHNK